MEARNVHLGCGPVFVDSPDWINLDFAAASPAVKQANLLGRLPLHSGKARLIYTSHFLEHIPRPKVDAFLRECLRVLRPDGVLRLVLPDLEEMSRSYLTLRDTDEHEKADFLVLEMIDQCVRREPGGELGDFYRRLRDSHAQQADLIAFVRDRTGEDLSEKVSRAEVSANGALADLRPLFERLFRGLQPRLRRAWLRLLLSALPSAFRAQNVSLAGVGERHHWLWDFHQLQQALLAAGFAAVERREANTSGITDFPFQPLDLDAEGRPRKGVGSMFVEARKPA
jgi:SAM-dependent methyltransferase